MDGVGVWNNVNHSISWDAFNNLSIFCPGLLNCTGENCTRDHPFLSPATFIVQVLRLLLAITLTVIVGALYNSVEVLNQVLFSLASCSFHWVVFLIITALKSTVIIVWDISLVNAHQKPNSAAVISAGFITASILQLASVVALFCSLEHEYRYRSPDYSSVDSLFTSRCVFFTKWGRLLSWPKLIVLVSAGVSLALLIVVEVTLYDVHNPLVPWVCAWVWLGSLVLLRVIVIIMGVCLLCRRSESFRPTALAKLYLLAMLLLSIGDDIPNPFLTIAPYDGGTGGCFFGVLSLYDIFQLLGTVALLPLFMFVRSQYLRVEQESKLLVVWDMQKLLQVNGRHDITAH